MNAPWATDPLLLLHRLRTQYETDPASQPGRLIPHDAPADLSWVQPDKGKAGSSNWSDWGPDIDLLRLDGFTPPKPAPENGRPARRVHSARRAPQFPPCQPLQGIRLLRLYGVPVSEAPLTVQDTSYAAEALSHRTQERAPELELLCFAMYVPVPKTREGWRALYLEVAGLDIGPDAYPKGKVEPGSAGTSTLNYDRLRALGFPTSLWPVLAERYAVRDSYASNDAGVEKYQDETWRTWLLMLHATDGDPEDAAAAVRAGVDAREVWAWREHAGITGHRAVLLTQAGYTVAEAAAVAALPDEDLAVLAGLNAL